MEPWTRVMTKITGTSRYTIEDRGSEWWQILESHTIYEDTPYGKKPLTVALVAQVKPGARRYKLEAGGKDAPIWDLITANVPQEMEYWRILDTGSSGSLPEAVVMVITAEAAG
ncbi:hypothetical protein CHU98_g12581 [Xylaria longipes]|nr:hypothetical protein CHU98_g12581 [Xylaria longipes]